MGGGIISPISSTIGGGGGTLNAFLKRSVVSGSQEGLVTKKPKYLDSLSLPISIPYYLEISSDGLAYVFSNGRVLAVAKCQDPSGKIELAGGPFDFSSVITTYILKIVVDSFNLYVLDNNNTIYKFDKRNPGNVTFVDSFSDAELEDCHAFAVSGSTIFAGADDGLGTTKIFSIDAETMTKLDIYETTSMNQILRMEMDGSFLICATQGTSPTYSHELHTLDALNPLSLSELGEAVLHPTYPGIYNLLIQDGVAYLSGQGWFIFVDINNKLSPSEIDVFSGIGTNNLDMVVWGGYMTFIMVNIDALATVDIHDFLNPFLVDAVVYDHIHLDAVQKISIYGTRAYTIAAGGGAANRIVSWDLNGYKFPAVEVGDLVVHGKARYQDDIEVAKDIKARGVVEGLEGHFKKSVEVPSAYVYSYRTPPAPVLVPVDSNDFKRIDLGGPYINPHTKNFDFPLDLGTYLGPRFTGENPTLFNLDFIFSSYNNTGLQLTYFFSVGHGNTDRMSISNISADGTTMTVQTYNPHLLNIGDDVIIEGTTGGLLDHSSTVGTTPGANTFTCPCTPLSGTDTQGRFTKDTIPVIPWTFGVDSVNTIVFKEMILLNKNDFVFLAIRGGTGASLWSTALYYRLSKEPS